ncbi:MAG: hypothetical protein ACTHU0_02765 [Kofleriaceae bacterium]
MATRRPLIAALALLAICLTGCFGYNQPAKRWAYVGDAVLMVAGGGAIAADVLAEDAEPACTGSTCATPPPFGGAMVAGVVLATAGLVGLVLNATRPTVKTSR